MDNIATGVNVTTESKRVPTGIDKLDDLLQGGFPKGSVILVSGTPGTGKTIACFQYLYAGLQQGEECLFVTSDDRIENLIRQADELGFKFKSYEEQKKLKFLYLNLDRHDFHKQMQNEIQSKNYTRIVLDSLTPLSEVPIWVVDKDEIIPGEGTIQKELSLMDSVQSYRMHIRRVMSILNMNGSTTMVTSEIPEGVRNLSRDTISEFLVDGILLLDLDTTMDRRKLTIRKMRGTKHTLKPQNIEIRKGGLTIV